MAEKFSVVDFVGLFVAWSARLKETLSFCIKTFVSESFVHLREDVFVKTNYKLLICTLS
jgi:hypothetical protein